MANETNESPRRVNLGPVTLAACLLEVTERLYARCIVLASRVQDDELAQDLIEEFEEFRNEWRPRLERMIRTGRLQG